MVHQRYRFPELTLGVISLTEEVYNIKIFLETKINMNENTKLLRTARTWHKKIASVLFIFFFVIAVTGLLLGWKNLFAAKIYSTDAKQKPAKSTNDWLPLDSLKSIAITAFDEKVPDEKDTKISSLLANMDKGFVRFSFGNQYNVQLNAQNGQLQSVDKKAPEWIIKLHDGELVDDLLNAKSGASKKVYTSVMGLALFFLTLSGFWMWFKPRQLRNSKKRVIAEVAENLN